MFVGTGVTVRDTQLMRKNKGEILMKNKLVAIIAIILVAIGATMTIAKHDIKQEQPIQTMTLNTLVLPILEERELVLNQTSMDDLSVTKPSDNTGIVTDPTTVIDANGVVTNEATITDVKSPEESSTKSELQPLKTTPTMAYQSEADVNYLSQVEQLIFEQVNVAREAEHLPLLNDSKQMQHYARLKSSDMANRDYFAHENPDGDLMTVFMQQDGMSYHAWGENIAYISGESNPETLAQQFMDNWMNSKGHRANILSSDFSSMGVGVYQIGDKVYATQEFYR